MALLAVLNGGFREVVLIPRIEESPGHLVSTGLLVAAILAVAGVFFTRRGVEYIPQQLVLIGATWVILTVGIEFLVGYVEGTPVSVTLGEYDVLAGQVWIAVPNTLFVAPLLFGWLLSS